jgi:hypothetical protein
MFATGTMDVFDEFALSVSASAGVSVSPTVNASGPTVVFSGET